MIFPTAVVLNLTVRAISRMDFAPSCLRTERTILWFSYFMLRIRFPYNSFFTVGHTSLYLWRKGRSNAFVAPCALLLHYLPIIILKRSRKINMHSCGVFTFLAFNASKHQTQMKFVISKTALPARPGKETPARSSHWDIAASRDKLHCANHTASHPCRGSFRGSDSP